MAFKKNSPGCSAAGGCGCLNCTVCNDPFDRSDSSNVSTGQPTGCTGVEVSGDWDIFDNTLRIVSTTNASIRLITTGAATKNIKLKIKGTNSGDKATVTLDNNAGQTLTATFTFGASGDVHLKANTSTSYMHASADLTEGVWHGIELRLALTHSAQGFSTLIVYVDGTLIVGSIVSSTSAILLFFGVARVLVGTGDTCAGTIYFDDFVAYSATVAGDTDCHLKRHCGWPVVNPYPDTLYLLIEDANPDASFPCTSGECSAMNGTYALTRVAGSSLSKICALYELTGLNIPCHNGINCANPATRIQVAITGSAGTSSADIEFVVSFALTRPSESCTAALASRLFGKTTPGYHTAGDPLVITGGTQIGCDIKATVYS